MEWGRPLIELDGDNRNTPYALNFAETALQTHEESQ
jgi:hypothetical protein